MIETALILAGGLGTRLRSVVSDAPKCMAPVSGKPFMQYIIDYYLNQGIRHFIFSLGYKHEQITTFLTDHYPALSWSSVIESEPLGTGGAIRFALEEYPGKDILIANGDTFIGLDVNSLYTFHQDKKAECTLALKKMVNTDRYGVVVTDQQGSVTAFREKKFYSEAYINAGVYILNVPKFMGMQLPEKFSFESDYLQSAKTNAVFGYITSGYFIDIGIPSDYERAQTELPGNLLNK